MTPEAIRWLLYDLLRAGMSNGEIMATLERRGATYEDLVAFILSEKNK